ncbi:hypothetical protein [Nonomuraea sp. NPDC050643]
MLEDLKVAGSAEPSAGVTDCFALKVWSDDGHAGLVRELTSVMRDP